MSEVACTLSVSCDNRFKIYVDFMTGKKYVGNMSIILWSFGSSSMRGGDVLKGLDEGYCYFSQLHVLLY